MSLANFNTCLLAASFILGICGKLENIVLDYSSFHFFVSGNREERLVPQKLLKMYKENIVKLNISRFI